MYEIKIVKKEKYNTTDKSWEKIADTGNEKDNGAVYDYVETEVTREKEEAVYTQHVEKLDLKEVIDAVNKSSK
jgi:hypothetical protein